MRIQLLAHHLFPFFAVRRGLLHFLTDEEGKILALTKGPDFVGLLEEMIIDMNSLESFRLDGKAVIVTGAGRGLGAKIAETLGNAGANVALTDVDVASLGAQVERLKSSGVNAIGLGQDVTDEPVWEQVVSEVISQFGGYDVLVNNAGVEDVCLFEDCDLDVFRRVQAINVDGTFLGIKHSIRAMKPGGSAGNGGSIINLSSVAGMLGFSAVGAYCAAKGAVRLMTKAAAKECGELGYGIRVNSIHPGLVLTDMGNNLLKGYVKTGLSPDESAAELAFTGKHPLGLGQPEDVANVALYLSSSASRWVTGAEHIVDGGWHA